MSAPNQVILNITLEERERLESLAHQRGYEQLSDYLLALAEADAEALVEEDEDPVEGFREGWRDIMTGNTFPISTLWDDLDDE